MIFWEKERMEQPVLFKDRTEAGQKLAQELKRLDLENPVVLAIPSGGVPVGIEAAQALKCPFGLLIVRRIQYPWTTEAGFGAIAADGTSFIGPGAAELSGEEIKAQTKKAQEEVKHRQEEFIKDRKPVEICGKTVILVDDGLVAGSTMLCAARSVRKKNPAEIVVAAPTASSGAVKLLKTETDKIITLYQHPEGLPFAVASSYQHWHDLTDEEVKEYLKEINEDK